MRYIMCIVVDDDNDNGDAVLEDTLDNPMHMDGVKVIHSCVRELEERIACPECLELIAR